jgi:hypothetical protein
MPRQLLVQQPKLFMEIVQTRSTDSTVDVRNSKMNHQTETVSGASTSPRTFVNRTKEHTWRAQVPTSTGVFRSSSSTSNSGLQDMWMIQRSNAFDEDDDGDEKKEGDAF